MKLKVLKSQDPKLRQVCQEVSIKELKKKDFQLVVDILLDYVYGHNNKKEKNRKPRTVGLSANQVGFLRRISVVDMAISRKAFSDIHVLINPQIFWKSKTLLNREEGCVNLPRIWGSVERSKTVKVKTLDRSGNDLEIKATGWLAILLQHEIDHLNGKLFIDHLPDPKKAHLVKNNEVKEYRKNYKTWNKFIDVSNLVKK